MKLGVNPPNLESNDGTEQKIIDALDTTGLPYEVIEIDPELADTAAFCERYGVALDDSANTIVVVGKGLAEGVVEVKDRASGEREDVAVADAAAHVLNAVREPVGNPISER